MKIKGTVQYLALGTVESQITLAFYVVTSFTDRNEKQPVERVSKLDRAIVLVLLFKCSNLFRRCSNYMLPQTHKWISVDLILREIIILVTPEPSVDYPISWCATVSVAFHYE